MSQAVNGKTAVARIACAHISSMPQHIRPMLGVLSEMPDEKDAYAFEYKWDGIRTISFFEDGAMRLESRNLLEVTSSYPELGALKAVFKDRSAVLDGEIVALDEEGKPSFHLLQHRIGVTDPGRAARAAERIPAYYMLFDVLYLDGYSLLDCAYTDRRRVLEAIELAGSSLHVPPSYTGEGEEVLQAARDQRLEGVMAKRLDSPYRRGKRSRSWLKIKIVQRQEFVVGGWVPLSSGGGGVGALLVGYYEDAEDEPGERRLMYAGKVGTGFTDDERERLAGMLVRRKREHSPFYGAMTQSDVLFAEPDLVVEVEYRGWTGARRLRQPSYKGMRTDKDPHEVRLE